MKNTKKIAGHGSKKSIECKVFESRALEVHVSNLLAHYGEEAVTRALALKLVKEQKAKKAG